MKILQRENDQFQGLPNGPKFWSRFMKIATSANFGGPAGGWAPGRRPAPKSDTIWLVETEMDSLLEEQFFIAQS